MRRDVANGAVVGGRAPRDSHDRYLFNDCHFHLTNYIQEGTDVHVRAWERANVNRAAPAPAPTPAPGYDR